MNFKILALLPILALTACGDEKAEKAKMDKELQAVPAIKLEGYNPTQDGIDTIRAAFDGDHRRVRAILEAGVAKVISQNDEGATPLMAASINGHEDVIEIILKRIEIGDSLRLDVGDNKGNTALLYAVEGKHPDIIVMLREHRANPNAYDYNRDFPIHEALEDKHLPTIDALLRNISGTIPTNINATNGRGETAIHTAVETGDQKTIALLNQYGANPNTLNTQDLPPLISAIMNNNKEIADLLISIDADVNFINQANLSPLIISLERGFSDIAMHLLIKNANPNVHIKDLPTPLQIAVAKENADPVVVKALLAKGAKISGEDMPGGDVISRAIRKGNYDVVKILIDSGANIKSLERAKDNALLRALKARDEKLATLIAKKGADVNKIDSEGYSVLALSIKNGFKDLTRTLIEKGADVNYESNNINASPVEIALDDSQHEILDMMFKGGLYASPNKIMLRALNNGQIEIVKTAINNKANPNIADNQGQPAIWLAVTKDSLEMVKALYENGARLDVIDTKKGATPLHMAIVSNKEEVIDYLLANGANPNAKDIKGLTPLAYAVLTNQAYLIEPLVNAGADVTVKDDEGNNLMSIADQANLNPPSIEQIKEVLGDYL